MKPANGKRLYIQEVSLRDGLQIEAVFVPTQQKIALIDALSRTGVAKIEATSFTSSRAIPALADAEEVMHGIRRETAVEYAALVPNLRGCERALSCNVDEINLVVSASESHNDENVRMSCARSLLQFADIAALAHGKTRINVSLATAFGCPFEGEVPEVRILHLAERLLAMGIDRISLCDTTGMANPAQVARLFEAVQARFPEATLAAHFHDTRSMGLANAIAAAETGIERFDASLGGLGGCPFAPGASGNVCTEDLVHMFEAMGYDTGVNLDALLDIARDLPAIVGHEVRGQVVKAGRYTRRFRRPGQGSDAERG